MSTAIEKLLGLDQDAPQRQPTATSAQGLFIDGNTVLACATALRAVLAEPGNVDRLGATDLHVLRGLQARFDACVASAGGPASGPRHQARGLEARLLDAGAITTFEPWLRALLLDAGHFMGSIATDGATSGQQHGNGNGRAR